MNIWRNQRLSRGWEPLDVVGRMKFTAQRQGLLLPPGWVLLQWVFLWENHRAPLPSFYEQLLDHVFGSARPKAGER